MQPIPERNTDRSLKALLAYGGGRKKKKKALSSFIFPYYLHFEATVGQRRKSLSSSSLLNAHNTGGMLHISHCSLLQIYHFECNVANVTPLCAAVAFILREPVRPALAQRFRFLPLFASVLWRPPAERLQKVSPVVFASTRVRT